MGEPSLEKSATEIINHPSSLPAESKNLEASPVPSSADSAIAVVETVVCHEADVPTENERCQPSGGSSVRDPADGAGLASWRFGNGR